MINKVLTVTEEEDNPFFSNRDGEVDFEKLVSTWDKSEEHWK